MCCRNADISTSMRFVCLCQPKVGVLPKVSASRTAPCPHIEATIRTRSFCRVVLSRFGAAPLIA